MSNKGFTLIEILLSLAIIALIAGLGVPVFQSIQARNDLDIVQNSIVQSLRRAQFLSQAVDGDASWGLFIQNGGATLFQGESYGSRNPIFDEAFEMPDSFILSGVSEVVYTKFIGQPQITGVITITSGSNESRTITINEKGTLSY